tara:strand:- start:111 stop:2345 length:2235 start_codon:yes stop_codon:yes gene_type:complete
MKILYFIILFTLHSFFSSAEIINDVVVNNNKRISKESIITLGNIKIGTNYDQSDLDQVLKNLYGTDFFSDIKISVENNKMIVLVDENKIIEKVKINGVKSKTTQKAILDILQLKDRSPFVEHKIKQDLSKIKNSLSLRGYYFSEVKTIIEENNNDTVNLIYDIQLGNKAKISRIEFVGNKIFKTKKLRNLIVSEEDKFWKFISNKKYINKDQISRDERLLKNYYLNRGYYDVIINASSAQYLNDDSFTLTFNIDAGKIYKINKTKLILPIDYKKTNFVKVEKLLSKLENEYYSFRKISKIVDQIDKISLLREYDFISASISEQKIKGNKINLNIEVTETEKFYVEQVNILGNDITQENVIRDALEVDEGDPFNELLHARSVNNLKAKNIFKTVKSDVIDGSGLNKKIININVVEKPTGEVMLGAGVGSDGGTIGFSVSENNFLGQGIKLSTSLRVTEDTIRGNFTTVTPNYKYSGKSLSTNIQSDVVDKMADSGYEAKKTGFSFGTSVEQYEDLFFTPQISSYYESLTTDASASDNLKKQAGDYFETAFSYNIDYDKRNQTWQTSEGYRSKFTQSVPVVSDNWAMLNGYDYTKWIDFDNDLITKFDFYIRAKNSITGDDVRVSERLHLPSKRLKGFVGRAIGPVDGSDFVGGNFSAAFNFSSTLPMILESVETADFKFFIDAANVWGVDYRDDYDDSNKIRSSTGIAVDWFTPIGPLNISIAQPLTKVSTDKTESLQFNLGTTF